MSELKLTDEEKIALSQMLVIDLTVAERALRDCRARPEQLGDQIPQLEKSTRALKVLVKWCWEGCSEGKKR